MTQFFVRALHWTLCGWHVGKLIGWLILSLASAVCADEFHREPAKIEPVPQTEPLPAVPRGNAAADTGPHDAAHAPRGLRRELPTIQVLGDPAFCEPCRRAANDLAGSGVRHRVYPAPQWVHDGGYGTPVFAWMVDASGAGWRYKTDGYTSLDDLLTEVRKSLAKHDEQCSIGAPAPGLAIVDQALRFAPVGSRITIDLPSKTTVRLDEGVTLSYSRLAGRVAKIEGQPGIIFEPPVPADLTKFGLRITVNLQYMKYEPPATAAIGHAFGKYRIRFEEAGP